MRSWLIIIVICLAIAGGLGFFKYQQIQAAIEFGESFPEPVEAVETYLVREETWQPSTNVTAEVVAIRAIDLSNELAGRIVKIGYAPGASVSAGQVLVKLDTSEEKAQLAAAQADTEIARLDLMRNQRLIDSGAAAQDARDRAKAKFDAASASVDRLKAIINKRTLRAPFDATSSLNRLEIGQYLDKASFVTRLIGTNDKIWIDFSLPQQQANIADGTHIQVNVRGMNKPLTAVVIARDAAVNEQSRNLGYRAIADNSELKLRAGTLVKVTVPIGATRVATLVPNTAVRRGTFGTNVFVLQPAEEGARAANRAEKRMVELGPQRQNFVVIASGLKAGEQVAAVGSFKLREGILVQTVEKL